VILPGRVEVSANPAGPIETAIEGSGRERFLLELFSSSAVFPVANLLLELLLGGSARYFLDPDFHAIMLAALVQAGFLAHRAAGPAPWRLAGNLVGPAIYTAVELSLEGARFFSAPHHVAYWAFSLAIGALQQLRWGRNGRLADALLVLESVVRSMILFAMYAIYESLSAPADAAATPFFADGAHVFIGSAMALLGLVAGIAAVASQRYLAILRALSRRLRRYSEWFLGRALLEEAVSDPQRLALQRRSRAILFMDVRGFTAWSETESPESVVAALNAYYSAAESVFARHAPIRFKFAADEVMAVFAEPLVALAAARELAGAADASLRPQGLGAGIGLHWGPVVEGLMGGPEMQSYDAIGDTVNTAKRIEGAAARGEILLSEAFRGAASLETGPTRSIVVKGKSAPLQVHLDA